MSRIHAQVTERITAAQLGDLYNRLKDAVSDVRADIEITTLPDYVRSRRGQQRS